MTRKIATAILLVVITAGLVVAGLVLTRPQVPPEDSYVDGERVRVLHTETSDRQLADTMSRMMHSPVLFVPSLAQAPRTMLANVYVFTNGQRGLGTRGFQLDVLDSPPKSPGYSPLRAVNFVAWLDPGAARDLKSAAEIRDAERKGEVRIEQTSIVLNTPLLSWPTERR